MLTYQTQYGEHSTRFNKLHIARLKIALGEMVRIKGEDARLGIRSQNMNDEEFEEISRVLFEAINPTINFTFSRIILSYNSLCSVHPDLPLMTHALDVSYNGIENLSSFDLKNNTRLESLHLHGNRLKSEHLALILDGLKGNSTLRILNLSDNRINLNAYWRPVHFELNSITTLSLARNASILRATSNVVIGILKTTTSLTSLNISSCYINEPVMSEILDAASSNTTLVSLDVSHNDIALESLAKFIRCNDMIKELSAYSDPSLFDRDQIVDALSANTVLTSIDIFSHNDPTIRRAIRSTEKRNMSLYDLLFDTLHSYIFSISFKRQRE